MRAMGQVWVLGLSGLVSQPYGGSSSNPLMKMSQASPTNGRILRMLPPRMPPPLGRQLGLDPAPPLGRVVPPPPGRAPPSAGFVPPVPGRSAPPPGAPPLPPGLVVPPPGRGVAPADPPLP